MGSVNFEVLIRYFFSCLNKMSVFDVLHRLVTYLWTKRYKCCIKSANYVMLTRAMFCGLAFVMLYCRFTFVSFVNVFNLNVPYIYIYF